MCAAAARAIKGTWRQQPAQPAGMALSNPLSSVVGRGYLQSQSDTIRYHPNPSDTCCLVVKAWLCRSLKPVSNYFEFLATDHDDNAFSWLSSFASIHYGLYCEIRVPVVGVFWMLFCQVFGSWTKSCPSSGQVKNLRLGIAGENAGTFGLGINWWGSSTLPLVGVSMTLANSHPLIVTYCLYDMFLFVPIIPMLLMCLAMLGSSHFVVARRGSQVFRSST